MTRSSAEGGFTPGPWASDSDYGTLVVGANGSHVAVTLNTFNAAKRQKPPSNIEEVKANARLIAAAPELLASLIALRDVGPAHVQNYSGDELAVFAAVDAAIAKATGEQP